MGTWTARKHFGCESIESSLMKIPLLPPVNSIVPNQLLVVIIYTYIYMHVCMLMSHTEQSTPPVGLSPSALIRIGLGQEIKLSRSFPDLCYFWNNLEALALFSKLC